MTTRAELLQRLQEFEGAPQSLQTPMEKVALFRSLFMGREDVFPRLWISRRTKRKGYSPVCANEKNPLLCQYQSLDKSRLFFYLSGMEYGQIAPSGECVPKLGERPCLFTTPKVELSRAHVPTSRIRSRETRTSRARSCCTYELQAKRPSLASSTHELAASSEVA